MHPSWNVPSDACPILKGKYPNGPVFLYNINYYQPVVSGKLLLLNAEVLGGTGLSRFVHADKVFLFNVKDPELVGFEFSEDILATRTQIACWAVTHVKKHKEETIQVICTIGEISIAFFVDPTSAEKIDITLPVPRNHVVCNRKSNIKPNGTDVFDWLMKQVRPVDIRTIEEETLSKVNDLFRQMGIREISMRPSIVSTPAEADAAAGGSYAKKASSTRSTLSYASATSIPSRIEDLYREIHDLEKQRDETIAQEKAMKEQEKKMMIDAIKNADSNLLSALVAQLGPEQIASMEQLIAIQLNVHSANAAIAAQAEATRLEAEAARRRSEAAALPSVILAGITIPRGNVISADTAEEFLASKKKESEERLAKRKAAKKASSKASAERAEENNASHARETVNPYEVLSNGDGSSNSSRVSSPSSIVSADQEADSEN